MKKRTPDALAPSTHCCSHRTDDMSHPEFGGKNGSVGNPERLHDIIVKLYITHSNTSKSLNRKAGSSVSWNRVISTSYTPHHPTTFNRSSNSVASKEKAAPCSPLLPPFQRSLNTSSIPPPSTKPSIASTTLSVSSSTNWSPVADVPTAAILPSTSPAATPSLPPKGSKRSLSLNQLAA